MKKNISIILLLVITLGIGLIIGSYLTKPALNNDKDNNGGESSITLNTPIKNKEVEEIFKIIKNEAWYPNYMEKNIDEITDDILLSIVARSLNKDVVITNNMYETIKNKNGEDYAQLYEGTYYVDESSDVIISKTNEIFNKKITKNKLIADNLRYGVCTSYVYNSYIDKFIQCGHCGGGMPVFEEVVYNYEELDSEINVYTAVAKTDYDYVKDGWAYFDKYNNTYEFNDFKITKENYNNFTHLKYTFKQYENGNYYIFSIEEV